jgi:sugar-specific transcriptional regulator TrmB
LTSLGLTQYQARVFLTLDQLGITNANALSRISKVPREKVYGILNSLMEMSLVNKMITSPATYKALRLDEAVVILLEQKHENLEKLRVEIDKLVRDYKLNRVETPLTQELPTFEHILGKEGVLHYMKETIGKTENSIDAVVTWNNLLYTPQFVDSLKKAKQRGVRIRVVLPTPINFDLLKDFLRTTDAYFCDYRLISSAPPTVLQIYDDKVVMLHTQTEFSLNESSTIVTNNSNFLVLANTYFEKLWRDSQPYKLN